MPSAKRKPKPPAKPLAPADMRAVEQAVIRLTEAGASFALVGPDKVPKLPWGKRGSPVMVSAEDAIAHLKADARHHISLILETLNLGLVDMDGAPVSEQSRWADDVFAAGAPPLCRVQSQSGAHHLFYRLPPGGVRLMKAARKWRLPRLDGVSGDPDAADRADQPLHGDLKMPGSIAFLPGVNVVRLAEAVLDGPADAGMWDDELDALMRLPRGDNLPALLGKLRASGHGAHNDTLNEVTYFSAPFRAGGLVERALMAVATATGHAAARCRSTIRSAYQARMGTMPGGGGASDGVGRLPGQAAPRGDAPRDGKQAAPAGHDGRVRAGKCAAGLAEALGHLGYEVGVLDDYGGALGVRQVGGEWAPLSVRDRNRIAGACRNRFQVERVDIRTETRRLVPFAFQPQELIEHLWEVAGRNRVNVMGDYLAGCPAVRDREEAYGILQGFASDIWELDPATEAIARVAIPAVLIGVVGRHLEPGTKMDAMTILAGPNGIGKSTFLRSLLPPGPEFDAKHVEGFAYGARHVRDDDEQAGKLRGAALVEFTELSPHGVDIDRLKGFVDRRYDTYREKYGTDATAHPRTCVLVATSNRSDILPHDPTGHRKFWLVRLRGMGEAYTEGTDTADFVTEYLGERRRLLWGAALACWRGWRDGMGAVHPCLSMPRHLWELVAEVAGVGSAVDPTVQMLIDRVESLPAEVEWLLPQEVAEMTGRVRVHDGEYVPAPDGLLKQVRAAMESARPAWTREPPRTMQVDGARRRLRLYRRAGVRLGPEISCPRAERRDTLGIVPPGSAPPPATEGEARGRKWGVYPGGSDDE